MHTVELSYHNRLPRTKSLNKYFTTLFMLVHHFHSFSSTVKRYQKNKMNYEYSVLISHILCNKIKSNVYYQPYIYIYKYYLCDSEAAISAVSNYTIKPSSHDMLSCKKIIKNLFDHQKKVALQ